MARQRRWSEDERREVLAAFADSGLSLWAFARAADVPYTTLAHWRRVRNSAPRLVPVEVEQPPEPQRAGLEVVFGDVVVRVGAETDDALLVRVVRALRAC
jgi:transposase